MDGSTKFLVDECLSTELVHVLIHEYGFPLAAHVTWIGSPPPGYRSWKDHSLTVKIAEEDYVFVTNNRRDFVRKHYPRRLTIHNGLIIVIDILGLDHEVALFRAVMDALTALPDAVNKLIEIDRHGEIRIADWPNHDNADPWADPWPD